MKVLQDLAGASGQELPVWDPIRDSAEARSTIIDPRSGLERPVVGLQLPFAAALATGSVMRVLLGQWDMVSRLRSVPDSVEEFAGYFIAWDPIAGTGPDAARDNPYRPTGSARVRNVMLPTEYGHLTLPLTVAPCREPGYPTLDQPVRSTLRNPPFRRPSPMPTCATSCMRPTSGSVSRRAGACRPSSWLKPGAICISRPWMQACDSICSSA